MTQSMIKEIALPPNTGKLRRCPFERCNRIRQRRFTVDGDERMKMIWHQKHQFQIPTSAIVVELSSSENLFRDLFMAKLISSLWLAANRNEIRRAESTGEMNRVIQRFSEERLRFSRLRRRTHRMAIEVNRRYPIIA